MFDSTGGAPPKLFSRAEGAEQATFLRSPANPFLDSSFFPRVQLLGNGRNTVSRVLFRRRELTEFRGKLGEFCEKLGEFALAHK